MLNKQLQYTYYPISHEVKATRQKNLVSYRIKEEKYFSLKFMLKMRQEVPDLFFFKKKALYEVTVSGLVSHHNFLYDFLRKKFPS